MQKITFHQDPIYPRIYADFGADNAIDNSSTGKETTNVYKQNPVLNGYHIVSELDDILKSGYYDFPSGYVNVAWFVNETTKLENKMSFYIKNTKKDIKMTVENEEHYSDTIICKF